MTTFRALLLASLSISLATACSNEPGSAVADSQQATATPAARTPPAKARFRVPSESEVSDTVTLASIRRGRALILATRDSLPRNVGNRLTCGNCHVGAGTQKDAMPLVGVYARFPQYRSRSGAIDLIENRINDCFERSMNGRALDWNGKDMRDMVAYLAFLSRGFPVGVDMEGQSVPALPPMQGDTTSGRQVYAASCVVCHGPDGQGTPAAPPLWGPDSYNVGAGMARVYTAARFIHKLMPLDRPGSLTPQQAHDVAAFVNSRPRPDFARKAEDWPLGGEPPDVAYETRAARARAAQGGSEAR